MANHTYSEELLKRAHRHSFRNRKELQKNTVAACFCCRQPVQPAAISNWTDEDDTALCPNCGIDAVLSEASGFPVTDLTFLRVMHEHWFGE